MECQPSPADDTRYKGKRLSEGSHRASDLDADVGADAD